MAEDVGKYDPVIEGNNDNGILRIPSIDHIEHVKDDSESELFGLNESSSNFSTLIIIVKQSIPVIISFFLSIGGTFIVLVFAGE